jgi:hypothetical protein
MPVKPAFAGRLRSKPAQRGLADKYDAAQARREVAEHGRGEPRRERRLRPPPLSGNIMIDTARAKQLRDLAIRLVRAGYNVETKNFFRRLVQYERGRLHIEYLSSRFPDVPPPKAARPFAFTILIRFDGAKVLSVSWDDTRTAVLIFKPGDWERYLAAYLASA